MAAIFDEHGEDTCVAVSDHLDYLNAWWSVIAPLVGDVFSVSDAYSLPLWRWLCGIVYPLYLCSIVMHEDGGEGQSLY